MGNGLLRISGLSVYSPSMDNTLWSVLTPPNMVFLFSRTALVKLRNREGVKEVDKFLNANLNMNSHLQ